MFGLCQVWTNASFRRASASTAPPLDAQRRAGAFEKEASGEAVRGEILMKKKSPALC